MTPTIGPARSDEFAEAVRLLFRHRPATEREERVGDAVAAARRGDLDAAGLLVARDGPEVVAAMLAAVLPGGGAAVWPPRVAPGVGDAVTDALAGRAVAWLRDRGVKAAQAVLAADELAAARPLLRHGFAHVTSLWYLRHHLELSATVLGAAERLRLTNSVGDLVLIRDTLARTYEGTEDFPELNGVRTPDDAMAGYRAGGADAARSWLAFQEGEPVGVLLVNPTPDWGGWDVAYVGVVPEARRRGVGSELMRHALIEAKAAGVPHVSLAVDVRNQPARELYRQLGFESFDRREVFLAVWAGNRAPAE
jgi:mycothiol synthase